MIAAIEWATFVVLVLTGAFLVVYDIHQKRAMQRALQFMGAAHDAVASHDSLGTQANVVRAEFKKRPTKVLFVDDDPHHRIAFSCWLEEQGFDVETAESGRQALEKLEANGYGLVVVDERMPHMSGAEFCEKARVLRPEIPRLLLTAYQDAQSLRHALNRGRISGAFEKTTDGKLDLVARMSECLGERRSRKVSTIENMIAEEVRKL